MPIFLTIILSIFVHATDAVCETSSLRINDDLHYIVEEAISAEQKAKGLMFREHMDGNKGMVFFNEEERPMAMWMKNTYIPLDMIFADKDGKIVCIFENTTPQSTEIIDCNEPVKLTLELNAGEVKAHNIKLGDKIFHRLLGNLHQN